MAYKIYKYTFPNGKIYVGKTKTSIEQRAGSNGCRYGDSTLVGRAIRKYGWVNITKEILYDGLTASEANKKEREIIKSLDLNNRDVGYNLTRGGDGGVSVGHVVSEETRRKIGAKNSVALKGRKLPKEQVERMRQSLKGHTVSAETREKIRNANLGKHLSEETKKKLSEINRNRSPDIIERTKQSLKKSQKYRTEKRLKTMRERYPNGFKHSEESKLKNRLAMLGKPKSEETKQKMRKPKSPEHIEHMKQARKISWEAKKLGMTYREYLTKLQGNIGSRRSDYES